MTERADAAGAASRLDVPYHFAARSLLPRCLAELSRSSHIWLQGINTRRRLLPARTLYRTQLAASAVAHLCEFDESLAEDRRLHEFVRTALIGWQIALRADGRPAGRQASRDPLWPSVAACVAHVLNDTKCFQTESLLSDFDRHLHHLRRRESNRYCDEAARICCLAEGATLVRDSTLLDQARTAVHALGKRQDSEGWFDDGGGIDLGDHTATLDYLARMYDLYGWGELIETTRRLALFMTRLVRPDATIGPCGGSNPLAMLSPYGVEVMAPVIAEASMLAGLARTQCTRLTEHGFQGYTDHGCISMAARFAAACPSVMSEHPVRDGGGPKCPGFTHLPHAGLIIVDRAQYHAVVDAKCGGFLSILWPSGRVLEDGGVALIQSHGVLSSRHWCKDAQYDLDEGCLTLAGPMLPTKKVPGRVRRLLGAGVGCVTRVSTRKSVRLGDPKRAEASPAVRHCGGRFRRKIIFAPDSIKIIDLIESHHSSTTILCRCPRDTSDDRGFYSTSVSRLCDPPVAVQGGRHVELTRVYRDEIR